MAISGSLEGHLWSSAEAGRRQIDSRHVPEPERPTECSPTGRGCSWARTPERPIAVEPTLHQGDSSTDRRGGLLLKRRHCGLSETVASPLGRHHPGGSPLGFRYGGHRDGPYGSLGRVRGAGSFTPEPRQQ